MLFTIELKGLVRFFFHFPLTCNELVKSPLGGKERVPHATTRTRHFYRMSCSFASISKIKEPSNWTTTSFNFSFFFFLLWPHSIFHNKLPTNILCAERIHIRTACYDIDSVSELDHFFFGYPLIFLIAHGRPLSLSVVLVSTETPCSDCTTTCAVFLLFSFFLSVETQKRMLK